MSRAYPGAAYPQSSYPRSAYPEGSRRDGQHHWRRSGRGWHSHRSNGWGGVGYQAPYFYSSSTYFVPSFWYPYGYNSFGSFLNDDDYDAFFNEQPSQEAYPAGYGPWDGQYSDGPGMEAPTAAAMPPLMNGPYREPYDEEGAGVVRQAPEVSAAPPPAIEPETPTQSTVAAAPEPQPATMLIFKDGRPAEKVYNYVITPTTIYSFHGNRREEIPVSSINVKATEAANRAAGVDFSLPSSADGL